jgi:light-regulated signal transduction histidine kinase (bacteriophytochrome)
VLPMDHYRGAITDLVSSTLKQGQEGSTSITISWCKRNLDWFVPVKSAALTIQVQQLFQNLIGNAIKYRDQDRGLAVHINAVRQIEQWNRHP